MGSRPPKPMETDNFEVKMSTLHRYMKHLKYLAFSENLCRHDILSNHRILQSKQKNCVMQLLQSYGYGCAYISSMMIVASTVCEIQT